MLSQLKSTQKIGERNSHETRDPTLIQDLKKAGWSERRTGKV